MSLKTSSWLVGAALIVSVAGAGALFALRARAPEAVGMREGQGAVPSDWFGVQRAFPYDAIPQQKYLDALAETRIEREARFGTSVVGAYWQQVGPNNIGGRVTALAAAPGGRLVYLGAANGGVFKSTNFGVNWTPVSDVMSFFSVGALAMDPADTNVVYVGTGEANSSVDSYDGDGVYRTSDGGLHWQHVSLVETKRIAAIAIDPTNSNRIFVGAMGAQFSTGPDRGLYRSEDRAATWQKVLFVNDSTGVSDVVINPNHPDTMYCATWERVRRYTYRRAFGPGCGIWRSVNGGTTWTRLQAGLPVPTDNVGRIALALSPSNPSILYAQMTTGSSGGYQGLGLYRSLDAGSTWTRRDVGTTYTGSFGGFSWYFGEIGVHPTNSDVIWTMGVSILQSLNAGQSYSNRTPTTHVDQHAIWIDPTNPSRVYLGNDGGFYWSTNGSASWSKSFDLPITQFYAGSVDANNPERVLGGTQDNNTLLTDTGPDTWFPILGGDGFYCFVDPTDSNVVFAEYQNGSGGSGLWRSSDGGASFNPQTGFSAGDRYNWNTPAVMDPNNHNFILVGSQRVYRSTDNGQLYVPISNDLTSNPPTLLTYGTITTLDISPADSSVYYVGTDDGRVWRSKTRGDSFENISAGLPTRYVTRVSADPVDPQVVYVTLSGFGRDEHLAHVYRSPDQGTTWTSISGNLPDVPANDLVVDPLDPNILYLATDVGIWRSLDLGGLWLPFGVGMPIQTVFDLQYHAASRQLFAFTHGRSAWKLDLALLPTAAPRAPVAATLSLSPAAPNPSRGEVRLTLAISEPARVDAAIYDVAGRRLHTLVAGPLAAGRHPLNWSGSDPSGRSVRPGVYYLRASAGGASQFRRIVRVE